MSSAQPNLDEATPRAAAASARWLAAIVESSDDAIIGKDLNSVITSWNQGAEKIFGYAAGEVVGTSIMRLIPPERRNEEDKILETIKRGEKIEHCETQRLTKDGRLIDVDVTVSPIKDDSGRIIGVSKTARDITARKRAETVLGSLSSSDSGTQREKVVRDLTVIVLLSAVVFLIGRIYDAFDPIFIYFAHKNKELNSDLDEVIATMVFFGLAMMVFSYRRWRETRFEMLSQAQITRALSLMHTEMEAQVRQRTAELVRTNDDLHNEIAERRRADELIAEQAALLDKARDAILVRDLDGKILFWNRGAENMYGWTRAEVAGRNIGPLLYADAAKFTEINALTISQGQWQGELQHLAKDGRKLTVEARWTLVRDQEGKPKSTLAINTDITERKKIEAQFLRAQRMESIGTLAGGIAHDLNNILAPIMMSIEILKTTSSHPQAAKILASIEVSAKRGADIVRQVLSFARGMEGERIEVQPKHLLRDLKNIIENTFPKDIRLHFSIPNETWTVLGDPTQVHQILLNLCVNARDAMPNGGSLDLSVENCVLDEQYAAMNLQARPGRYVIINVTDSGTGIPPEIVERIFEPFFTTKELNKGTGLGLSTVMAIVKSHEGLINVYSEPGKGTTFKVYLPAAEISTDGRKEQAKDASLPRGEGETILVVDDEASILSITSQTLQAFGYKVLTATDGADALAVYLLHKSEIAVVLTDMMMPVMDGPAMIHALMRINPAIKIIAASGLKANNDVAAVSGTGITHFLTKPYTAGSLLKMVRKILDA